MTEEEILAAADNIRARRERQHRGKRIFMAHRIVISGCNSSETYADPFDSIDIDKCPELVALLCKVLDVPDLTVDYEVLPNG